MRSCLPLRPTLNHDSPLVYPGLPRSPFRAESARVSRVLGATGAEPGDARAAAAARAGRAGAARRRAASRRPAVAGAAQPLHRRSGRGSPASGRSRCRSCSSSREVVRIGVMRGTIHLLTADDCLLLRPADPAGLRGTAVAAPRLLAAAARRRSGSGRRGGPARARRAADGHRAASVPRGAISGARRGSARLRLPDAACARAGAAARALEEERPGSVDDGRVVARAGRSSATPSLDDDRAPLPRRVRPCVGRGRDDVVPADRPARRWSSGCGRSSSPSATSAAASSSTFRPHRGPDPRHAGARPLPARVRQRPAVARRPQPVRLGVRSRAARAGVVGRLGRGAPRRRSSARIWRAEPDGLVVRHVPLAKRGLAAIAAEGRRLARFLEARPRRAAGARQPREAGPAARQRERAPLGGERERVRDLHPLGEREREPGGEAVARAVRVLERPRRDGRLVRPARLRPAAERARGRDDEARRRIEVAGLVALGVVLPARDERVELDSRPRAASAARGRSRRALAPAVPGGPPRRRRR